MGLTKRPLEADPGDPKHSITERGFGYRLRERQCSHTRALSLNKQQCIVTYLDGLRFGLSV